MSPKKNKPYRKVTPQTVFACSVLIFLGYVMSFAAKWYTKTYGDTGFDSVMFTLTGGLDGVQSGLIESYLIGGLLPAVLFSAATVWLVFFRFKRSVLVSFFGSRQVKVFPFSAKFKVWFSVTLSVVLIVWASFGIRLIQYIIYQARPTYIFDESYVDPNSVEITFPEQKRNLVFITVESLETTFLSKSEGGGLDYNIVPNLSEIANNNINFSNNGGVGGAKSFTGTTWTAGGLIAHTAGIPLKVPFGLSDNTYGNDTFLPGVVTLFDVLRDNGYYQAVMLGSDSHFANGNVYFTCHGVNKIYDYYTARDDKLFPEDYKAWWGYEDKLLFSYAKQELSEISTFNQPFSFMLRTADTHHIDGYVCSECKCEYEEQYENVFSCADRQLYEFIEWLKAQPFYENTTIVITGDHLTMDSEYITRNVDEDYERHIYNCIINSAISGNNYKNRQFASMDLFPTTLAAMGCRIEGERLGIGTNLFSQAPTLTEEMGVDEFEEQMSRRSEFYNNKFIYMKKETEY